MPFWVIFLSIWPNVPVFHEYGDYHDGADYTACGRKIGPYKPGMPYKHAVKFGRPCKGCFPE